METLEELLVDELGQLLVDGELGITKGSALEIPQNTGEAWNSAARDVKGRALGYKTGGAPNVPV